MAEMLDVYNLETNEYEGRQLRSLCHGNPALLHRTSQVVVIHPETGDVLLQKRKLCKEILTKGLCYGIHRRRHRQ